MKVAIVGSRDFDFNIARDNKHTQGLANSMIKPLVQAMDNDDYVVSGGALGADSWGEQWARNHNVGRIIHAAHWEKHGKAAGAIRNRLIVRDADVVFAFHTNREKSIGTANCVKQARKAGVDVYEFDALRSLWYYNGEAIYIVIEAMYGGILAMRRAAIESSAQRDEGVYRGIYPDGTR